MHAVKSKATTYATVNPTAVSRMIEGHLETFPSAINVSTGNRERPRVALIESRVFPKVFRLIGAEWQNVLPCSTRLLVEVVSDCLKSP